MYICTLLPSNQSFYRQITSQEGWCCQWGRPVVRDGNRVQDSCKGLNWGALDHASRAPQLSLLRLLHVPWVSMQNL